MVLQGDCFLAPHWNVNKHFPALGLLENKAEGHSRVAHNADLPRPEESAPLAGLEY
jgi:hypothetical protein